MIVSDDKLTNMKTWIGTLGGRKTDVNRAKNALTYKGAGKESRRQTDQELQRRTHYPSQSRNYEAA